MATDTLEFHHPRLGAIAGRDGDVVSFRGIPYATLSDRLAEAQLVDEYPKPLDATNVGPIAHPPPGGFQLEMALMQQSLAEPALTASDLSPLNLNIWVPRIDGQLPASGTLPVFAWVHGGGFVSGSSSWPQYDMARLVRLSREAGTPVIGVSFNFRLGMPGYLTSAELRSAGYKPNNQLRDQRVAFAWLKKNIAGFGGAEGEITVAGESAGAVDVGLHLQSKEPLFERAVMMGGSPLLLGACGAEYQEGVYARAIEILALQDASPSERIKALLTTPMDDVVAKLFPPLPYRPMVDGDLIPSAVTYASVADRESTEPSAKGWLKGLMVGDSQFDGSCNAILLPHIKPKAATFPSHVRSALASNPAAAEQLLEAYNVSGPTVTDEAAYRAFLDFATDLSFYAATVSYVRGWGDACAAFFLNERNPGEGAFRGEATHVFDVVLLFQNFNAGLPPAVRAAAEGFARDLLAFASGREGPGGVKVYGPSSWDEAVGEASVRVVGDVFSDGTGRRGVVIEVGEKIGFDTLAAVAGSFMAP